MAESPIRIAVELEGIEPNVRFQSALDELTAAAAELIDEASEVTGYLIGDDVGVLRGEWTDPRPGVKGFNIGMPPSQKGVFPSRNLLGDDSGALRGGGGV